MIEIKILSLSAGIAMFKELGLMDAANALIAGDHMGAFNIFFNNIAGVIGSKGINSVLSIILKYAIIKNVLQAIPGTGKQFNILNIVKLSMD